MSIWLKQSTARTLPFGPFVDSGDGDTEEEGFTISQADIRLSKNGGAFAQTNNNAGASHLENGFYGVPLDTTDTNTLGHLRVAVHESGGLYVWQDFMVVPANVWDSMFGSDLLQVDQRELGGSGPACFITSGTVSSATSVTSLTITGNASIRKGDVIVLTANTGAVAAQIVFSHNSGTGATVMESPGFPVQPDNTTTYHVLAGINPQAITVNANDRVEADVKEVNGTALDGDGSSGDKWRAA